MASVFSRLSAIPLLIGLVACGTQNAINNETSQGKGVKVVSTFLPITLFTEAVAGDCAEVTSLIPPNLGPHDFQATPSDLTDLSGANVLVKNGLEMEEFLDDLIDSADNKDLVVIDSSKGVETIKAAGGGHDDHDEHSDDHHDGEHHEGEHHDDDDDHDHGHDHGHGHSHGEYDPHIWLDPVRAAQQVENIRDGLVKADPSCAEGYRKNADQYTAKLKELNTEFTAKLKPYSGKTFVAFHDFATYFANRYSLKAEFLVDLPEMNPSPADLQRVATQVKESGLKALLTEPQEGNRSFNALAKDLGVNIVEFNPLETGSAESAKKPGTYFEVMRSNVNNLTQAIGD
ncbi:ABC zinc transport system/ substrate-binding protein [Synechococcus sp. BIOS-E4-1]|uniref:metal ABC transporter solute-binding protein, Zn/Mn family n=1 Tax=Synechococcus sp. BIOS-E4-1 TaxID=1400864 RepID=UPI001648BFD4|nr:zinc ABC transporter substrate-binding protein [Synechococcus sp. BIOS-E4-1]QNI53866.1 ABC zinc transport system/ substrate-binding protein [Synechococcus sp. BIOS-E4-1]